MSENDFNQYEAYIFSSKDNHIVAAVKQLLWKTARSEIITATKLEVVARILKVFDALPSVIGELELQVQITGPRRSFGSHEIHHWWHVEVENGSLCVTSGGYFYRPETGGDSFTSMIWRAYPGYETELEDYLDGLSIVDDAKPFDEEVDDIDFTTGGYSIAVFENGEELEDECGDGDEHEDDENEDASETSDAEYSDQMPLREVVKDLESVGVECVWANREMTDLYSVDLKEQTITDTAYKLFHFIPSLHMIDARNTDISDSSLAFISHFDSLEWLCLRRTTVTDEGLRHLRVFRLSRNWTNANFELF